METKDRDLNKYSAFAKTFNITSMKTDPVRWNKEWEKAVHPLSAKEVYTALGKIWDGFNRSDPEVAKKAESFKRRVCGIQNLLVKLWDDMEQRGHFVSAWLLLGEKDREAHFLKGLEQACQQSLFLQDSRAMCPEIKISSLQKRRGNAYIDFIRKYTKGKKDMGPGEDNTYHLPSEWWEKAVDASELLSQEGDPGPFAILTMQRNEFIGESMGTLDWCSKSYFRFQRTSSYTLQCRF